MHIKILLSTFYLLIKTSSVFLSFVLENEHFYYKNINKAVKCSLSVFAELTKEKYIEKGERNLESPDSDAP